MRNYRITVTNTAEETAEHILPFYKIKDLIHYCQEKNLTLLSVKRLSGSKNKFSKSAFKLKALYRFTETLHQLLLAKLPLLDALTLTQSSLPHTQKIFIHTLAKQLKVGASLSDAIMLFKSLLPTYYIPCIRAGEATGNLTDVLAILSHTLNAQCLFADKIRKVLAYPTLLAIISSLTAAFLLFFVLPSFQTIYNSTLTPLPPLTQHLSGLAITLKAHPLLAIAALTIAPYFVVQWSKRSQFFYRFMSDRQFYFWSQIISLQLKSNLPLIIALENANQSTLPTHQRKKLHHTMDALVAGESLENAFSKTPWLPEILLKRLSLGESTADLPSSFEYLAHYYKTRHENRLNRLSQWIEPVMMIGVAIAIGFFIIAMYMPLFNLGLAI